MDGGSFLLRLRMLGGALDQPPPTLHRRRRRRHWYRHRHLHPDVNTQAEVHTQAGDNLDSVGL